jgi:SulP family sulfate permease
VNSELCVEPGRVNLRVPASEAPARESALFRFVPALGVLRQYSLPTLRADVLAGLTVAAVAVPQAMAYASVAGLPPQYGLYTAIVMTAVGALLDSSRQLINGPTNAISIAVLAALAPLDGLHTEADRVAAAVLLALLVGLMQTGITLLRLAELARHVSPAVISGFTTGAAVLLVLDQLKHLLGLRAGGTAGDRFLKRFWLTVQQAEGVHLWTAAIAAGTVVVVLGIRALGARLRIRLPDYLLAVLLMAVVTRVGGLNGLGVAVVGPIPARLPSFEVPALTWDGARPLALSALTIALLGLLEAMAMARAIAARTGQQLDLTQQCLSEGMANVAGSFFHCFPGSGSLTRSALNQQAGAMTQWSGVVSAAGVAGILLLFAPLAQYLPRAALAGVLLLTAWRLVDRHELLGRLRISRGDAITVLATAVCAVAVSVEACLVVGVVVSLLCRVAARWIVSRSNGSAIRFIVSRSEESVLAANRR